MGDVDFAWGFFEMILKKTQTCIFLSYAWDQEIICGVTFNHCKKKTEKHVLIIYFWIIFKNRGLGGLNFFL